MMKPRVSTSNAGQAALSKPKTISELTKIAFSVTPQNLYKNTLRLGFPLKKQLKYSSIYAE
jgi:hypothetical protein